MFAVNLCVDYPINAGTFALPHARSGTYGTKINYFISKVLRLSICKMFQRRDYGKNIIFRL